MWLTQFGPSPEEPAAHLRRGTAIFPSTVLGHDGLIETLTFEEEQTLRGAEPTVLPD